MEQLKLFGCVTTLASIAARSPNDLEDALGFNRGALKAGYWVYRLAEMVKPNDFEWLDTTRYANGWHYDPESDEWVQRQDEERWASRKRNDYDGKKGDVEFDGFMGEQRSRLNVRTGWALIVKVISKERASDYPDSKLRTIPQWRISKKSPKSFTLLFDVKPGESCPVAMPVGARPESRAQP